VVPNGDIWIVGRCVQGYVHKRTEPDEPTATCPSDMVRAAPALESEADKRVAACDALYHAVCDYCDTHESPTELTTALDKYERGIG
jgi:hypothetical protein